MAPSHKPIPRGDFDSQPFWDGCSAHELRLQRCARCAVFRHPPRPLCHQCGSSDHDWVKVDGRGSVYSWTIVRNQAHPALPAPYAIVVVELAEAPGIRMVANLLDASFEDIVAGMPVELVFEDLADGAGLPQFRPSPSADPS